MSEIKDLDELYDYVELGLLINKSKEKTMNEKQPNEDTETVYNIPIKLRHSKRVLKLTVEKQKRFLELLHQEYNWTKAAAMIGVTRKAIEYLYKRDERFKESVELVKESWMDRCEESGLQVASIPTREGYNDRKLFLAAHRIRYQQKPEIQQNILIHAGDQETTITQILQDHMPQTVTLSKPKENKDLQKVEPKK